MKGTVCSYETAKGQRWRFCWTEILSNGNRFQHSGKGFLLKRDAEAALRRSLAEYDKGGRTNHQLDLTLGEYLSLWLGNKEKLEPSTRRSYEITVDRIVAAGLGNIPLRKTEVGDVIRLKAALKKPGTNRRTGSLKPLSDSTINRTLTILGSALKQAVKEGKIMRNPCDGVEKPSTATPAPESWTAVELREFLAQRQSVNDRLFPLWHLAANTGMRRSELLGLRWENIDLEAGYLRMIQRSVMVGSKMIAGTGGKTSNSVRTIDLDPATVAVLKRWHETQALEAMMIGEGYDLGTVFTGPKGQAIHADRVGDAWTRSIKESGATPLKFKGLRSTHCSLLIANGVPVKAVSERLGHASVAFTMSVYQKVLPGAGREAATAFAALLEEG